MKTHEHDPTGSAPTTTLPSSGSTGRPVLRAPVVELIGPPGAGKTRLADIIRSEGHGRLHALGGGPAAAGLLGRLRLSAQAPKFSALCYLMILARPGARLVNLRYILPVQRRYLMLRDHLDRPAVLDEGPIHALFSAMFGSRGTWLSGMLLRRIVRHVAAHVDVFLHIETAPGDRLANLRKRKRTDSRFHAGMPASTERQLVEDPCYGELLRAIAAVAPHKLVTCGDFASAAQVLRAL